MKPRIIFIHGNGATHWSFAWSPWFKHALGQAGFPTFFETMPDSVIARSAYWLPFLHDHVKAGKDDVLVGWSSGAVAAMRYAEKHRLLGSVLISPSYTDLDDELEKQSGYFDAPWDWHAIRSNQANIALVWGDNDPYIPQTQFQFIARQLRPTELRIVGGKHFIERRTFPEVLEYIVDIY